MTTQTTELPQVGDTLEAMYMDGASVSGTVRKVDHSIVWVGNENAAVVPKYCAHCRWKNKQHDWYEAVKENLTCRICRVELDLTDRMTCSKPECAAAWAEVLRKREQSSMTEEKRRYLAEQWEKKKLKRREARYVARAVGEMGVMPTKHR